MGARTNSGAWQDQWGNNYNTMSSSNNSAFGGFDNIKDFRLPQSNGVADTFVANNTGDTGAFNNTMTNGVGSGFEAPGYSMSGFANGVGDRIAGMFGANADASGGNQGLNGGGNNKGLDTGMWGNNTGSTLKGAGSILSGAGSLASAWTGLKNVKLAREAMGIQVAQWDKNYAAQRDATNNRLNDQNSWKKAQGRSDMATLIT